MATGRNIRAGGAFVEIFAQDTAFNKALERAQRKMAGFEQFASGMGRRMMTAGAAMLTPIGFSMESFMDFDDQMRKVEAFSEGTERELTELRDMALRLGKETAYSATQIADGMSEIGKMGFNRQEIADAISPVLDLAQSAGHGYGLVGIAKLALSTLKSFKLPAAEARAAVDAIAKTANTSAADVVDLGYAFSYAATPAERVGMKVHELGGIMAVLHDRLVRGTMAGTSFRMILAQLADTEMTDTVLGKFGITGVKLNAGDAVGSLKRLNDAIRHLPRGERLNIYNKLFGDRAMVTAQIIGTSSKTIQQKTEAINKSAGEAARAAAKMQSGMGGSWRKLLGGLFVLKVAIGEALDKAGWQRYLDAVRRVVDYITDLARRNHTVIASFVKLALGITAAGVALFTMGVIIRSFTTKFGMLNLALRGMILLFNTLPTTLAAVAVGFAAFKTLQFLSPESIEEMKRGWATIKTDTTIAIGGIKAALMRGDLGAAMKVLWAYLKLEWVRGVTFLQDMWTIVWTAIKDTANSMWAGLRVGWEGVIHAMIVSANWLAGALQISFVAVGNFFSNLWAEILAGITMVAAATKKMMGFSVDTAAVDKREGQRVAALKAANDEKLRITKEAVEVVRRLEDGRHSKTLADIDREKRTITDALDKVQQARLSGNAERIRAAEQGLKDAIRLAKTIPPAAKLKKAIDDQQQEEILRNPAKDIFAGTSAGFSAVGAGMNAPFKKMVEKLDSIEKTNKEIAENTDEMEGLAFR